MSVIKREQIEKEKLELPPPLKFAEREQTQLEKLDAPPLLNFAKEEHTEKEKLDLPPPLGCVQPLDKIIPLLTITAPTGGFGYVVPMALSAILSAILR